MNAEKIFDVMENIDEQYIIEAHQKNVIKNKKKTIRKIVVFAACFSLIISITAVVVQVQLTVKNVIVQKKLLN